MLTMARRDRASLRDDRHGLAMVEFALIAPVLLVLIVGGLELANYGVTSMRVSALALQVADNASRIGEGEPMAAKKISEAQINDLLRGALAQGGDLDINGVYAEPQSGGGSVQTDKARVIVSSLEPDTVNPGRNYIHWQRCYGKATGYLPRFGVEGDRNLAGMGPTGRQAFAPDGSSVIFVEVHYRYEPLFPVLNPQTFGVMTYSDINTVAAMVVRDDRDISRIYNNENVTPASCT